MQTTHNKIGFHRLRNLSAIKQTLRVLALLVVTSANLFAQGNLLSLEAQAVGSYNDDDRSINWYSQDPHEAMQKPSVGVDYLYRAGSATRDYGYLSLQARLAYDDAEANNLRLQIYNAFVTLKQPGVDLWLGHHKTALGLSSYLNNHALLMMDNTMSALNFDRDWGLGLVFDRQKPIVSIAATTGSGMPLYVKDNYLLTARIAVGEYSKENYSFGLSGGFGRTLRSMGYEIMHNKATHEYKTVGVDFSKRYLSLYTNGDLLYGSYHEKRAYSGLLRLGYYLLQEDKASVELQAMAGELTGAKSQSYAAGLTYHVSSDVSIRSMFSHIQPENTNTISLQLYLLKDFVF